MVAFQVIPVGFGALVLLLTLLRLYRREMAVRAHHIQRGKENAYRHNGVAEGRNGWTVPQATGSDTWGYTFFPKEGLPPPTRCWWIKTVVLLFLSGHKREPGEQEIIHARRETAPWSKKPRFCTFLSWLASWPRLLLARARTGASTRESSDA